MRVRLVAGVALSCATISASAAADLGARVPASRAPSYFTSAPVFSWSGFYVGLTGGYGWGNARFDTAALGAGNTFRTSGPNLGSTFGYNMQAGSMVYGLETDLSLNWAKGSNGAVGPCPGCEASSPWFGTFRGRIGYALDPTLFYLTGGLAYGGVRVKNGIPGGDERHNKIGWTLGGGVEYAFAPRWSAKLEYLYVDLGKTEFTGGLNVRFNENIIRAGLNSHF